MQIVNHTVFSRIGRLDRSERILLIVVFLVINLLSVLLLWYSLMKWLPRDREVAFAKSVVQLQDIEFSIQELNTSQLALWRQSFGADIGEHIDSRKPELSYLLDLIRAIARSNHVRLQYIRPGEVDVDGALAIDISAHLSMSALVDFWSEIRQTIYHARMQGLNLQVLADHAGYELSMSIKVETGLYVDDDFVFQPDLASPGVTSASGAVLVDLAPGRQAKGFILRDNGNSLVYLRTDNEGRLQRVSNR
jgi:hypothetical protein